jgi:hypothetical protein
MSRQDDGRPMKPHRQLRATTVAFAALALTTLATQSRAAAIYDRDPNHPWNRLHNCLLVRRDAHGVDYGADVPDPLLWDQTKHLLAGESYRQALHCLDDFLRSHAENSVQDPVKRAVLQHDVWAVFDWALDGTVGREPLSSAQRALTSRLAEVMRRVALTADQIRGLPDGYEEAVAARHFPSEYDPTNPTRAFLPPDLFHPEGSWVCLSAYAPNPTVSLMHSPGHFRFLVFMHLPGGRRQTLEYVRSLRNSGESPLIKDKTGMPEYLNLKLPQVPVGTAVALVRQMMLIDAEGKLVASPITETIQFRVYHGIPPARSPCLNRDCSRVDSRFGFVHFAPSTGGQDFFEFRFSRPALFARQSGGLTAVRPEDTEFPVLFTFGIDPFESSEPVETQPTNILQRCTGACHSGPGIHSVESRLVWMKPNQHNAEPGWDSLERAVQWETERTIAAEQRSPKFKLLQQYWKSARSP